MKAIALKPILYKTGNYARVASEGEEIDLDATTFQWRLGRGDVKATGAAEEIVSEGLPALDEIPISKGKKK